MNTEQREDKVSELETDILCEALEEFIEAMRDEVGADNREIRACVIKELDWKLAVY